MKKVVSLIFTMAVLVLMLAGCSSNSKPEPASSSPAPASSAPAPSSSASSPADEYPTKPIEIINPSKAGGETDIYGRLFAKYMEKELGQPLVTVNMAGGGGTISTNEVNNSAKDGYRVLTFHNGFLINKLMELSDLDVNSFEMAAIPVLDATQIFITNAKAPYNNIKEMVEYVKAGNSVRVATEVGSFTHFQLVALQKAADVEFDIVDAGTTPEKIAAMLGGNVDVMGTNYASAKDYITNGDFKALGLLSEKRNPNFSDVPTFKELGYDVVFDKFFFFAFPKGTDKAIVKKFNDAAVKVGSSPEFIAELKKFNSEPTTMTADEVYNYMKKIQEDYSELLK